ncbi:MAG: creatininase family protein [Firmicutes bacterium]|nr:creatininase family protein [Candidatus Colivicinus equi]
MYLDEMSYLEVEEYLKHNDTIVIVTGSTENHGKHMPLGTDTFIPNKIMQIFNDKYSDEVIIAPALPYGSTEDLKGFAGTVSVGPDLLTELLNRLCDDFFDYGFRRFIIVNGHGGNSKSIERTGLHLYKKGGLLARVDWWLIAGQVNPMWKGGHGGGEETAGVMAYDESLIKKEYLNEGENLINDLGDGLPTSSWTNVLFEGGNVVIPRPLTAMTDNGYMMYGMEDRPSRADAKWGTEMVTYMADYVEHFLKAFKNTKLPKVK